MGTPSLSKITWEPTDEEKESVRSRLLPLFGEYGFSREAKQVALDLQRTQREVIDLVLKLKEEADAEARAKKK